MLRVQVRDASNTFHMSIEGRFSGEYAQYVQSLMAGLEIGLDLVIDITDVTFIDSLGEAALRFFKRLGAVFVAENSYSMHICERLELPLSAKEEPKKRVRGATLLVAPEPSPTPGD